MNEKLQATGGKSRHRRAEEAKKMVKTTNPPKIIPNNIWIVKPGENTNRGHGISVCSTLKEIKAIICQSDYDKQKTFIVQKYIEKPALYN